MRDIGNDDGSADFSDVPIYPVDTVGQMERVVFGKNSADDLYVLGLVLSEVRVETYDKSTKREDQAQDDLLLQRKFHSNEQWQRNAQHHQIR